MRGLIVFTCFVALTTLIFLTPLNPIFGAILTLGWCVMLRNFWYIPRVLARLRAHSTIWKDSGYRSGSDWMVEDQYGYTYFLPGDIAYRLTGRS